MRSSSVFLRVTAISPLNGRLVVYFSRFLHAKRRKLIYLIKAFWDATGGLWARGALTGKYASVFISTGSLGGGQEVTAANAMSTFVHHGLIFVPLGYKHTFAQLSNVEEVHGGSPWGAGTIAGADGSRQPSALELEVAKLQGKAFYEMVAKVAFESK